MGGLAETFKRLALNTIDGDEFSRELVKYTLCVALSRTNFLYN